MRFFLCIVNDCVLISLSSQGYNLLISGVEDHKIPNFFLINTANNREQQKVKTISQEKLIDD